MLSVLFFTAYVKNASMLLRGGDIMKKKKFRHLILTLAGAALCAGLIGCGAQKAKESTAKQEEATAASSESEGDGSKFTIVTTNFPSYDFARAVLGTEHQDQIQMLLKPGAESHSYEPTPQDIISIQKSKLFIYVGGDSDEWVDNILDSFEKGSVKTFKLMDQVDLVEETIVEGMEEEHDHDHAHEHEEDDKKSGQEHAEEHKQEESEQAHTHEHDEEGPEMDEHVWTSPKNAIRIVEKLNQEIDMLDPANRESYDANAKAYIEKLQKLDQEIGELVAGAKRKEIIVADRFPFAYFCKEYGLSYYAAFPGCSQETQPSAKTVAFLEEKVKSDQIPVVFHIELSNTDLAKTVSKDTGAKMMELNAVHNVTDSDFAAGKTYAELMEENIPALTEALNG